MKILVIGGSYFLGRWFVQLAHKEHDITVLNRGNIPVGLDGVKEIAADRHNDDELCKLESCGGFDAVVDFCAYGRGEIGQILKHLNGPMPSRYIYVSTVDVYKKGTGAACDETSELTDITEGRDEEKESDGTGVFSPETEYIIGKTELEHELISECTSYGIKGVSVRPVILYGPGNYAPRESVYLEWIRTAGQIIHPVDADGYFQMLYVADAARGLIRLCEAKTGELKGAYNFCTDEILTYDSFERALAGAYCLYEQGVTEDNAFTRVNVTVETVTGRNIPLPFPLTKAESEEYSGKRFAGLGIPVTPLKEGLFACFRVG
ncbi:MAG: NAD-dependent epimerase/dehydratase family protein [Lachnospiraceae bacterium]|nr:NAD-dependent epimerase/dehydratase family protein [Lachnospiraceae bacterium]